MKNFLIVGHRATGKTTLGRKLRSYGFQFHDLDEAVRQKTDKDAATWVRESEREFRELEISTLNELCQENKTPTVIAVGAGCLSFPSNAVVLWLWRDTWADDAYSERERLRPEMSFEEEVAWMRANREPVWKSRAHLFVDVPAGRSARAVAGQTANLLHWCRHVASSPTASKTWLVPTEWSLNRAIDDAQMFGFTGVELRDDLIRRPVELRNCIASIRKHDSDWLLQHPDARMFDVDATFVPEQLARLSQLEPRPLVLSTHPDRVDPSDVESLVAKGRDIERELPTWAPHLIFKYAPAVETLDQIGFAKALVSPLAAAGLAVTMLPQGPLGRFARPLLVDQNATNYIPATLRRSRFGEPTEQELFDFQDWLPSLVAPHPTRFAALVGTSASASRGDVWHRGYQIDGDIPEGYVKIDVPADQSASILPILETMGIERVSVTSPFKTEFAYDPAQPDALGHVSEVLVRCNDPRMANTLARSNGRWVGEETDSAGMKHAISDLRRQGLEPGTIAIIGKGGVHRAVLYGIELFNADFGHDAWTVEYVTGARDGWVSPPEFVVLVVNASGVEQFDGAPRCSAWLDLHYTKTTKHPDPEVLYANGDAFFEGQAIAQRIWWSQFD